MAVGLVLAAARRQADVHTLVSAMVLLAHAAWRSFRPVVLAGGQGGRHSLSQAVGLATELAVAVLSVVSTGYWRSPFVFALITPVIVAGFARGYALASLTAVASILAVGLPYQLLAGGGFDAALDESGQWSVELLLVAVLAGFVRHLFGAAEERHTQTLDRMARLTEANSLLVSLHRVAQTLPASLNLEEVTRSTVARLRGLIDCDVTALLLRDESSSRWLVGVSEGTRLGRWLEDEELPAPLRAATTSSVASLVVVLAPGEGLGLDLLSRSGLYAPLRARGTLVGLLALEHHEPGRYGRQELQLLDGFVEPVALAIDNARWFGRIRAMGAEEERTRIARDMHDRVGQSLAYVAFNLDRLARNSRGHAIHGDLEQLRHEVRTVLTEVRETLGDLRTDVSDQRGLAETLGAFLERVGARSGLKVDFSDESSARLPLVQERELWRIAHEAIVNAERHARARRLEVQWECDGRSAALSVWDDGRGFSVGQAGRMDSFGITGMRERADAIGARLELVSAPQRGTLVRCLLEAA